MKTVHFCVFDSGMRGSHNRTVSSVYRLFAVALLAALVAAPCLNVCAGWSGSDHARMACCVGKSQDEADSCCAAGEGRQNADVLGGLVVAAVPVPSVDTEQIEAILTASQIFTPHWDSHDRIPSGSDRHVLLSVFLI
jgi:hypothetical protein